MVFSSCRTRSSKPHSRVAVQGLGKFLTLSLASLSLGACELQCSEPLSPLGSARVTKHGSPGCRFLDQFLIVLLGNVIPIRSFAGFSSEVREKRLHQLDGKVSQRPFGGPFMPDSKSLLDLWTGKVQAARTPNAVILDRALRAVSRVRFLLSSLVSATVYLFEHRLWLRLIVLRKWSFSSNLATEDAGPWRLDYLDCGRLPCLQAPSLGQCRQPGGQIMVEQKIPSSHGVLGAGVLSITFGVLDQQ